MDYNADSGRGDRTFALVVEVSALEEASTPVVEEAV